MSSVAHFMLYKNNGRRSAKKELLKDECSKRMRECRARLADRRRPGLQKELSRIVRNVVAADAEYTPEEQEELFNEITTELLQLEAEELSEEKSEREAEQFDNPLVACPSCRRGLLAMDATPISCQSCAFSFTPRSPLPYSSALVEALESALDRHCLLCSQTPTFSNDSGGLTLTCSSCNSHFAIC